MTVDDVLFSFKDYSQGICRNTERERERERMRGRECVWE